LGLAASLLDQGIQLMKIFPFDPVADESGGQTIGAAELRRGLAPIEAIRSEFGDRIEIALELRARWSLPAAKAIAAAAEDLQLAWIEDPLRNDTIPALREFAATSRAPLAVGENLGSRHYYRDLLENDAVGIVLNDPCWCGGVTEARRVADMAAMYMRPYAAHDCTGPVGLAVGIHLSAYAESGFVQEIVRAFYFGWYEHLVEQLPTLQHGALTVSDSPGHGIVLSDRPDFIRRSTNEARRHAGTTIYL
jgi:L-alanine-DL-glutamate epimerase-like enolase superfamily enzyme